MNAVYQTFIYVGVCIMKQQLEVIQNGILQAATSNQFNNSRQQHVHVSLTGISCTAKLTDSVPSQRLACTLYYITSTSLLLKLFPQVTLISSDASVCPGGSLVFTCTSDTGLLAWESDGYVHLYYTEHQPASTVRIFAVKLTNITGMLFTSTATVHNAQHSHNGSIIACSDSGFISNSVSRMVQISGWYQSYSN